VTCLHVDFDELYERWDIDVGEQFLWELCPLVLALLWAIEGATSDVLTLVGAFSGASLDAESLGVLVDAQMNVIGSLRISLMQLGHQLIDVVICHFYWLRIYQESNFSALDLLTIAPQRLNDQGGGIVVNFIKGLFRATIFSSVSWSASSSEQGGCSCNLTPKPVNRTSMVDEGEELLMISNAASGSYRSRVVMLYGF
jgi:hypothetical protein